VLVTRPAEDAAPLAALLHRSGFVPVVVPLLERRWRLDALVALAAERPHVDRVVVTSATTADVIATAAPEAWRDARWAAVGDATAARLRTLGYNVETVPARATGAALVEAMGDLSGQVVLYPRADRAEPRTADALRSAGADVIDVVVYDNVAPRGCDDRLRAALPVDATTLLSGSAAERVAAAIAPDARPGLGVVVALGPSTAQASANVGLQIHATAVSHTLAGVVAAVARLLASRP
jgi:uroporphyrinogen-III synthase